MEDFKDWTFAELVEELKRLEKYNKKQSEFVNELLELDKDNKYDKDFIKYDQFLYGNIKIKKIK